MTPASVNYTEIGGIRTAELILPADSARSRGVQLNASTRPASAWPVLMLHGWGASLKLVQPLGERLAALGWNVYAPDMPAFGESAPPPAAWGVPDYANWVTAYLDAHHLERVHLFGHSFGGRVALVLGAERAERLGKIALADAAGVPPKKTANADLRLKAYKTIRDGLYKVGAKGLADDLRQRYNARYGSADFNAASGVVRETFVKVVNQDLRPYAARVKPSTLLFWGDQDEDTPLWMGRELETLIPDAGLIIYEGAGHYSYLERLAETAKTVDYFFRNE
jgi:pimeloyl-ACP methyl ester carboxylesterase